MPDLSPSVPSIARRAEVERLTAHSQDLRGQFRELQKRIATLNGNVETRRFEWKMPERP
jgi:hypothetical protein